MVTVQGDLVKSNLGKRKRGATEQVNGSAKFAEYLHVMQPPSKSKIWSNEDLKRQPDAAHSAVDSPRLTTVGDCNEENNESVPKKLKNALRSHQDMEILDYSEGNPTTATGILSSSGVTPKSPSILDQELLNTTDGDWLRSRTKNLVEVDHTDDATLLNASLGSDALAQEPITDHQVSQKIISNSSLEAATGSQSSIPAVSAEHGTARVFVRNLAYSTTEDDLREYFSSQGSGLVQEVRLVIYLIDFQMLNFWPIL